LFGRTSEKAVDGIFVDNGFLSGCLIGANYGGNLYGGLIFKSIENTPTTAKSKIHAKSFVVLVNTNICAMNPYDVTHLFELR
jgi:hypothetical protein